MDQVKNLAVPTQRVLYFPASHRFEVACAIFYADSFKYDKRRQAEDRNHRIGQWRRPVYLSMHCLHSIDDRIDAALSRKGSALEEFQARIEQYRKDGMKQKAIDMVKAL